MGDNEESRDTVRTNPLNITVYQGEKDEKREIDLNTEIR